MAQYTIADIEILRQKSGISYEEAVNLLEYHNGSLARSLVDLEKNGRLRDVPNQKAYDTHCRRHRSMFDALFRFRLVMRKGDITVLNLSVLFLLFALFTAPWLVVIGTLVALVLGYRIATDRESSAFSQDTLESMLHRAGDNVRNTVNTFARDCNSKQAETAEQPQRAPETEARSESPASGTTPVNVQFSDEGSVRVSETRDGYHEAEIQ